MGSQLSTKLLPSAIKPLAAHIKLTENCQAGWNEYIGTSLPQYIATGKGAIFEKTKA